MQDIIPPNQLQKNPQVNTAQTTTTPVPVTPVAPPSPTIPIPSKQAIIKPPLWRRLLTGLLVSLTVLAAAIAGVTYWAADTMLNTDTFVATLAPLAENPTVKNSVGEKITEQILNAAPPEMLAVKLLPNTPIPAEYDAELIKDQLRPVIQESVDKAVAKPEFAGAWRDALAVTHTTITGDLESRPESYQLRLQPVIEQVLDSFDGTAIGSITQEQKQLILGQNSTVELTNTTQIDSIKTGLSNLNKWRPWALILPLVLFALALTASPYRLRTSRRIFFGIALQFLLTAVSVYFAMKTIPNALPEDVRTTGTQISDQLFGGLLSLSLWLSVLSLLAFVALKIGGILVRRKNSV